MGLGVLVTYQRFPLIECSVFATGRVSGGRGMEGVGGGSFGYMLEKELRFDDDYSPSTRLSRMPAYHNSLGHTREPPLAK